MESQLNESNRGRRRRPEEAPGAELGKMEVVWEGELVGPDGLAVSLKAKKRENNFQESRFWNCGDGSAIR